MADDPTAAWLARDKSTLREAVRLAVAVHVKELRDKGASFYGYALMPGASLAEVTSVCPAYNAESDIPDGHRSPSDPEHAYYRFGVNEWKHYDHERNTKCFNAANAEIKRLISEFEALHEQREPQNDEDFFLEESETQMNRQLFEAVFNGLRLAKEDGVFGAGPVYLCVWFNDNMSVVRQSVEFLNDQSTAQQFAKVFG